MSSKRYILNPDTNRLVHAEGRTGLKVINKLLKNGMQIKYQSAKSKTCNKGEKRVVRKINGEKKSICVTETRKKCPKGEIKHGTQCIKKEDKPKGTRGRPKTKTSVSKPTPKKKPTVVKQQNNQVGIFQKYDKIVKEIKSVYTPLNDEVNNIYDQNDGEDPYDGFPDRLYIKFKKLNEKMPVFVKFSGFSDKRIKQIIKSCYDMAFNSYDTDAINPVSYLEYVLNSVLVGEPTLDIQPLLVLLHDVNATDFTTEYIDFTVPSLDMAKIKPLTESRLLSYNTAINTVKSDNAWEGHQQYFKL